MVSKFTKLPQFTRGKTVEKFLDEIFGLNYEIRQTTQEQERSLCIGDRIYTRQGKTLNIEYKSGIQTHYTGNIFIETISVDDPRHYKKGWVYTCKADYIIYATILDGCLLVFRPDDLRNKLDFLRLKFKEVATSNHQNDGYDTHGLIIPVEWAKSKLAYKVIPLTGPFDL